VQITVLQYVKLEFRREWRFDHDNYAYKPLEREGELIVLRESPVGGLETYWFSVQWRDEAGVESAVIAPREQNIVYIPELCVRREPGDHTECKEDTTEDTSEDTSELSA
jgi:hypothetical protein